MAGSNKWHIWLKKEDFGRFHLTGSLGKKLIFKVNDLMVTGDDNSLVHITATFKEAIIEFSKKGLGIVLVVDKRSLLLCVFTNLFIYK